MVIEHICAKDIEFLRSWPKTVLQEEFFKEEKIEAQISKKVGPFHVFETIDTSLRIISNILRMISYLRCSPKNIVELTQ